MWAEANATPPKLVIDHLVSCCSLSTGVNGCSAKGVSTRLMLTRHPGIVECANLNVIAVLPIAVALRVIPSLQILKRVHVETSRAA
jgi:hypothetical protein